MKAAVVASFVAGLLSACSGSMESAEAPAPGADRVFVEAVLGTLDKGELARARSLDMDQVWLDDSLHLVSSLGGITEQGVPLVVDPGAQAKAIRAKDPRADSVDSAEANAALERLEVTPTLTSGDTLRLDMKLELSADGSQHSFTKAELFSGSRLLVWDTGMKTRSGESIVLFVQPLLIQSERDLKELAERRAAQRAPANP